MAGHPAWTKRLLSDADFEAISASIADAESQTSGMIKVHLERRVHGHHGDALDRAKDVFARLQMHQTVERHAVLIYLALEDRKLAVIGDRGIHDRVGDAYWASIRDHMVASLRAGATSRLKKTVMAGRARRSSLTGYGVARSAPSPT